MSIEEKNSDEKDKISTYYIFVGHSEYYLTAYFEQRQKQGVDLIIKIDGQDDNNIPKTYFYVFTICDFDKYNFDTKLKISKMKTNGEWQYKDISDNKF